MTDITERFLKYVSFDTQSADGTGCVPSTEKQWALAHHLKDELKAMGLTEVVLDDKGYLYATLEANTEATDVPTIGFIAHIDTSPDCSGANVKPRIIKGYDGGDIVLDAEAGIVTRPEKFPELLNHIGEDLIVTDGHTLLGADDKAGIAEIVSAMDFLIQHPEIKHGKIRVAFNPDEEIGLGAHSFDVARFGADWAYTMDGSEVGEIEFENFNAATAKVKVHGVSVHPGYAKNKMVNAARVATEFAALMPEAETPEHTEGYEGFYHLIAMEGSVEEAELTYIVRDHDRHTFEARKRRLAEVAEFLCGKYGPGAVTVDMTDSYYNMREKVEPQMHIVDICREAMKACGIEPRVKAIRGGTDGAQLSFMGLPCPNIFAGGLNFHGPHEFVPIQSMEKAMRVVVNICRIVGEGIRM